MTSKLLAAATLMLVTTASAWAESGDGELRLQQTLLETVELNQDARQDEAAEQDSATGDADKLTPSS